MKDRVDRLQLNKDFENKKYIIYWVQESQRENYNFSLEKAIQLANQNKLELFVIFNVIKNFPEASERHFKFMLQGLKNLEKNLKKRKIKFFLVESIEKFFEDNKEDIGIVLWDKSYLRPQREFKEKLQKKIGCSIYEVESNVLVPVEAVSGKEEYSAKTLRDKYNKIKSEYIVKFQKEEYEIKYKKIDVFKKYDVSEKYFKLIENEKVLEGGFIGGEDEARKRLKDFIENRLEKYPDKGPDKPNYSQLSPYLHFGNISPLEIYLEVSKEKGKKEGKEEFLEQVIIRRELAINFVYYNRNYDKWENISYEWAYKTLEEHEKDKREYLYTREELEKAETHDKYWNLAQKEMMKFGYMENYMRMYWGKKILEWSKSPKEAYETALYLNNKYLYDGRDPNSYAGVAWCFGKHDRAWKEREIFGKIRYMNDKGLERKFKMEIYEERILKNK